jgi:ribosomal protein L22
MAEERRTDQEKAQDKAEEKAQEKAEEKAPRARKPAAAGKAAQPKAGTAKRGAGAGTGRRRATGARGASAKADAKPKEAETAKAKADEKPKAKSDEKPKAKAGEKPKAAKPSGRARGGARARPAPARKRQRGAPERPIVRARAKYVRSSARKARLVLDHIRGKPIGEARAVLRHTQRGVARDVERLLKSAIANAENNHELVGDDLLVKEAYADEGPTLKRFRPRALGRATRIRKRTSHLTVTLTPKE